MKRRVRNLGGHPFRRSGFAYGIDKLGGTNFVETGEECALDGTCAFTLASALHCLVQCFSTTAASDADPHV